jgi:NTE family protein
LIRVPPRTGGTVADDVDPGITVVDTDTPPPRIGFALSGGGSRGSFALGALAYLTQVMHVGASVISGTSVGALSALKLAASPPSQQAQATSELIDQWTALSRDADMWTWEPWLQPLLDEKLFGGTLRDFLEGFLGVRRSRELYGPRSLSVGSDVPWLDQIAMVVFGPPLAAALSTPILALAADKVPRLSDALGSGQAKALTNLGPTEATARAEARPTAVRDHERSGTVRLRLATVCLENGRVRYVTGTGEVLERDNATPMLTLWHQDHPECAAIAKELADMVAAAGDGPRHRGVTLGDAGEEDSSQLREKMRALEECRRQHRPQVTTRPATVDVVEGAMASAAAPAFFPPRTLLNETYVDAGIREVIPVDVALRCGAELVYAISVSAVESGFADGIVPGLFPRKSANLTNLMGIAGRSLAELTLDEVAHDDIRGFGDAVNVIAPTFNVHSGLVIDPGLIDIWIDYGLMRASDVAKYPPGTEDGRSVTGDRAVELSDHLTRLRVAAWIAEHVIAEAPVAQLAIMHSAPGFLPRWQADGPSVPWKPEDAVAWARFLRIFEAGIVEQRERVGLVAGRVVETFLGNWERHPFSVPGVLWPNPVTRLPPAADPPARRLAQDMGSGALYQVMPTGAIVSIATPQAATPPGTSSEVSGLPPGLIDALRG